MMELEFLLAALVVLGLVALAFSVSAAWLDYNNLQTQVQGKVFEEVKRSVASEELAGPGARGHENAFEEVKKSVG
ncbi:hypothetical protein HZC09_04965 [Candidatus Micrarchaeota archaeon]|nr:hypothetical protein [Candidatus Micrarchaeota archaeon]